MDFIKRSLNLAEDDKSCRSNRFAVIIGINNYQDEQIPNLYQARSDAEGMYEVLTNPDLGYISPENAFLFLDEQATQRKIRSTIGTEIPRLAGPDDVVFIYFAGHGSPVIDPKCRYSDGMEKYLIPYDAEIKDLRATGIAMEEIQKFFSWIESKQVFFFIDSCYSGEAGGRTFWHSEYQRRALLTNEFLDHLASSEGRIVITACDVNEVSLESPSLGHGLFTHYIIKGLRGEADKDRDNLVTINELYEYVYENVEKEARNAGGSMHPIQKGAIKGKIYLTQCTTKITESKIPANPIKIERKTPATEPKNYKKKYASQDKPLKTFIKQYANIIIGVLGVIAAFITIYLNIPPKGHEKYLSLRAINNMPDSIYLAMSDNYTNDSLVFAQLRSNPGKKITADLEFELKISELFSLKQIRIVGNNFSGTKICTLKYPDMKEAFQLSKNELAQALIKLNYDNGKSKAIINDVKFFHKNYIDFPKKQLLYSFITPNEIEIRKLKSYFEDNFAKQIASLVCTKQFGINILKSINLFYWIKQAGISYDRNLHGSDLNYLQFPLETLSEKVGTNNDLAILFTTLLVANDIPATVIPIFKHLIVFINTGITQKDYFLISSNENIDYYCIDGDSIIWLPIDMNHLSESFVDAWIECRNYDLPKNLIYDYDETKFRGTRIPSTWKFEAKLTNTKALIREIEREGYEWQKNTFDDLEDRGDVNSLNRIAVIYLTIKDEINALTFLSKSIEKDPRNADTNFLMGRAYFQQKKYNEAIRCFQKTTQLDSVYAEAYFALACSFRNIGKNEDARRAFKLGKQLNERLLEKYNVCNPDI